MVHNYILIYDRTISTFIFRLPSNRDPTETVTEASAAVIEAPPETVIEAATKADPEADTEAAPEVDMEPVLAEAFGDGDEAKCYECDQNQTLPLVFLRILALTTLFFLRRYLSQC